MLKVGRLCVKTAGRDAMEYCVIVEEIDKNFVLIDGNVRRKKVNKIHLEPLNIILDIKKGDSSEKVIEAFKKTDIEVKKDLSIKSRSSKPQFKKDRTKSKENKKKSKKEN
jgi:large subunit ribosomal protein L14e